MTKPTELRLDDNEKAIYQDKDTGCTITETPDEVDADVSNYIVYLEDGSYLGEFTDARLTDEEKADFESTDVYVRFQDIWNEFCYDYYMPEFGETHVPEVWHGAEPKEDELEEIERLCKSDTIVFHKDDPSTVMLRPIYAGRGWDVYTGTTYNGLSKAAVNELIKRHDKILFMGHGTPYGLIGGNMDAENSHLIKDKKVFALWCYAATFLKSQGLHGIFCSDNCPSESIECRIVCNADVSEKWIFDNMVYFSECIRDVIDICWDNPEEACRKAREAYSKAKADTPDEKKVVEFNTNTLQVS